MNVLINFLKKMGELIWALDTIIQRVDTGMLRTDLGEEMVMMDIESGNYISLNNVGRLIWELVEQPTSVKLVLTKLTQKFAISEEQCFEDCCPYLTEMVQHKILQIL